LGLSRTIRVVIPTLNEAKSVGNVISQVKEYVSEILVIDGHSSDGTREVAARAGAQVLTQTGKGKGQALREAFYSTDDDIVVFMDADGSMKPDEIPPILRIFEENPDVDIVKGSRFLPPGYSEDMTAFRRIGNLIFLLMVNGLWFTDYTDLCYGFGAFRKEALRKLLPTLKSKKFEIETEICIKARKLGLKVLEVPSVELKRVKGVSRLSAIKDGRMILKVIFREMLARN
jgi:cellulose synthase/poly-beta-1,6-N-acetylglucosamine synthase-like glycosyltransferase